MQVTGEQVTRFRLKDFKLGDFFLLLIQKIQFLIFVGFEKLGFKLPCMSFIYCMYIVCGPLLTTQKFCLIFPFILCLCVQYTIFADSWVFNQLFLFFSILTALQ